MAKRILEIHDELVFAVGMASESHTMRNPFTAGERIEMLRISSRDAGIDLERIITVTVPTLDVHVASALFILKYSPKVDEVVVGNRIVARMFQELGVKTRIPEPIDRARLSGARVRELMARGDPEWKELVTPGTARFIEELGGPERLKWIWAQEEARVLVREGV